MQIGIPSVRKIHNHLEECTLFVNCVPLIGRLNARSMEVYLHFEHEHPLIAGIVHPHQEGCIVYGKVHLSM